VTTIPSRQSTLHRGFIVALFAGAAFGLYPAALRAIYADGGNAAFAIIVTTWIRALSMAVYCLYKRVPLFPNVALTKQSIIGGFFQCISIFGILGALTYIPGPIVIIIVFTHSLMLLFFMAFRKEIKLDATNLITTAIALVGLSLVLDIWHSIPRASLLGMALAFMSALATVSRLYVYDHQTKTRNPIAIGAENFLVAAVLSITVIFIQSPHLPTSSVGYLYTGLGGASLAAGTFGMFYGISLLGSFQWSLFAKIEPVFTSIFSIIILKEYLAPHQYIGIAIVIGSLATYQIIRQRQSSRHEQS
jgi:drug/metabolite transporter (DMT)-like permease